jgi:hypothetical protein
MKQTCTATTMRRRTREITAATPTTAKTESWKTKSRRRGYGNKREEHPKMFK